MKGEVYVLCEWGEKYYFSYLSVVEPVFSSFGPLLRSTSDGCLSTDVTLSTNNLSFNVSFIIAPVHQVQVKLEGFAWFQRSLKKCSLNVFPFEHFCLTTESWTRGIRLILVINLINVLCRVLPLCYSFNQMEGEKPAIAMWPLVPVLPGFGKFFAIFQNFKFWAIFRA